MEVTCDGEDNEKFLKLDVVACEVAVNGHHVVYKVTIPLEVVVRVNIE